MKRLCALLFLVCLGVAAPAQAQFLETELADPPPDFDQPRKIMLQISTDDEQKINDVLWNAVNLQKFYGFDNVQIAIIAFGPGMVALYREDSPVRERIENLLKFEIGFVGCANTMETTQRQEADLIEGVEYVQAGIAEIVERQLQGWIYIHP